VDDGKVHFVQNLAKHPESGVFLYRFSYRDRIHAGSTGCYRLSEARDFVNAIKGKLSLEGVGIKKPLILSFRQVFNTWMTERAPQRTEKYVRTLRCLITNHALPLIGGIQICQLDSTAINTVLNRYLESHTRSGTNTFALHLGALLGFAVEKGWIKDRPSIPMIPVQRVPRPVVAIEILDRFLEAIDAQGCLHASFLVRAQLLMGMRNHEARMMKWSGLRMDQKIFIPEKTKNGDAPVMPIPEIMLPWFDRMAKETGTFGFICCGKTGEPRAHDFTARYIKRAALAVGLPENLTDHRLRASFANILNNKGVPLPTIQKLMRHAKVETTMIYIETREQEMRTAINLMG
jgi:integrase